MKTIKAINQFIGLNFCNPLSLCAKHNYVKSILGVLVFLTLHSQAQTIINPSSPLYDSAKAAAVYSVWGGVSFITDSADYQPGSTAKFTGEGFFANEMVRITVKLLGNPPGIGNSYLPFDVQCDINGGFDAYWYVDSQNLGRHLQADVIGLSSGFTSIALFTDGTPSSSCYFAPDASYTTFAANDDGSVGPINLGFTFNLYGVSYTQAYINNNGNITFGAAQSAFSSTGFPNNIPMVAGFWADVDTRGVGNNPVKYKLESNRLIVTWPGSGYYSQQTNLLNTFQIIISNGTDASIGLGNNIGFNYGDMQWTTGSASGGTAGFGGTPATVGISKGDNVNYVQVGRFGLNSSVYDGGAGGTDGVNYLDYECFAFNVSSATNQVPSMSGAPNNDTLTVACGASSNLQITFLPPEVNQTVSTVINTNSMCNVTTSTTSGATSVATINVTGASCNMGYNTITYTATDNFNPPAIRTYNLTVKVIAATTTASSNSPVCAGSTINLATTSVLNATAYNWTGPAGFSSTSQNPTITNATTAMSGTYTVTVTLPGGCTSPTSSVNVIVNAKPIVPTNTGSTSVCMGSTTTLSNTTSGGVWSSASTSIATVNASGVVTPVAVGTSIIKYVVTNASGCKDSASTTITVSAVPVVNALTGTQTVCVGGNTTFASTTTGGSFSSSNTAIATVNTSTGVITGITAGTATISYVVTNASSCNTTVTRTVTVNANAALPSITGNTTTFVTGTTTLSNTTSGGVWSSSNTAVATINSSTGVVTGVTVGTAIITYSFTNASGCISTTTTTITINPIANP